MGAALALSSARQLLAKPASPFQSRDRSSQAEPVSGIRPLREGGRPDRRQRRRAQRDLADRRLEINKNWRYQGAAMNTIRRPSAWRYAHAALSSLPFPPNPARQAGFHSLPSIHPAPGKVTADDTAGSLTFRGEPDTLASRRSSGIPHRWRPSTSPAPRRRD